METVKEPEYGSWFEKVIYASISLVFVGVIALTSLRTSRYRETPLGGRGDRADRHVVEAAGVEDVEGFLELRDHEREHVARLVAREELAEFLGAFPIEVVSAFPFPDLTPMGF